MAEIKQVQVNGNLYDIHADKATKDESGNNIKASYAASFSISGNTITLKNKNGASLGTVATPTYSAATNNAITLSGTTFSHSTAAGYKHIPSGGSANQALVYDSAGTAKWQNIITFARWEAGD